MELNDLNAVIIEFVSKGYKMDYQGSVFSPKTGNKLKAVINGKLYSYVCLRFRGKVVKVYLHKLQAYLKYGNSLFNKGIVVRHLDGNSLNNSWDNIAIGTQSENHFDKPKKVRVESATTASRAMQDNRRSLEERYIIYDKLLRGIPYSVIIKEHSTSKGTLSYMKNNSLEYNEYIKNVKQAGGKVS